MIETTEPSSGTHLPPHEGLGWRVSLSIIVGVGWLVFLILWLFFYAARYSIYQNVAIVIASILIVGGLLGAPWIVWGRRYMSEEDRRQFETPGFKWRLWVSPVLVILALLALIYWFFAYAGQYSVYQNIAILIVALLILGGVLGAMWAPWGIKYGRDK